IIDYKLSIVTPQRGKGGIDEADAVQFAQWLVEDGVDMFHVAQTGKDYADMEGLCYKMAFNYEMAKHPDPFTEAKGYNGPVLLL
ncbi:hypothetical protein R2O95_14460, partial [Faecalibacterium duncaniae]|nr:hypothetical protein [Faecalibacterium duncaniae]